MCHLFILRPGSMYPRQWTAGQSGLGMPSRTSREVGWTFGLLAMSAGNRVKVELFSVEKTWSVSFFLCMRLHK